jgi:ribosomal protein S27E
MAVTCDSCGHEVETTEDVEVETVEELAVEEAPGGPPSITYGVSQRDVYMCKGCGKLLGVS